MEWQETDVMPKVAGVTFRCECGCNVFRKHVITDRYKCNSCQAVYIGESETTSVSKPVKQKRLFKIKIEYFKPSGKFYSEGTAEILATDCRAENGAPPLCYMHDVTDEIRRMRAEKRLPGLSGGWDGPIYVDCEDGFPCLIVN